MACFLCRKVSLTHSDCSGVGTAAAAAAMAAAHSRLIKKVGQLYSINAHAQVMIFELVRSLTRSGRGQYFKASISRGTIS